MSVATTPHLLACLCAGWCKTCDAYRDTLARLAASHPAWRCVWVDIEDHADALDEVPGGAPDIENFPTLLLVQEGSARFLGTVLPHATVAERLLAQAERQALAPLPEPATQALARVVQQLADSGALE